MNARAPLMLGGAALLLAACGSTTSAAGGTAPSASAQPGGGRGGTFGQIVQVQGTALTVSTTTGDVNVAYTTATTITSTSTGTPGDIVTGTCVVIAGLKDSSGAATASTVRLSHPVNGSCSTNAFPGGGRPGGGFSPPPVSPGATPRPTPNPNAVLVTGMVTAVSGTTVTVTPATGAATSVAVPTTLTVTESSTAAAADLTVNSCVRAVGQKDSQGVVQATALTLQPANSSGTCTAPGGGGFGGGRFPGGGGGGGFPGGGTPPTAG
jgi:hypothetical protein